MIVECKYINKVLKYSLQRWKVSSLSTTPSSKNQGKMVYVDGGNVKSNTGDTTGDFETKEKSKRERNGNYDPML